MSFALLSCVIVFTFQLIVFVVAAFLRRTPLRVAVRILLLSMVVGLPFGMLFDYTFGYAFGFYEYMLGFGPLFIAVNGAVSFGIMLATGLLFFPPVKTMMTSVWYDCALLVVIFSLAVASVLCIDTFWLARIFTGFLLVALGEYLLHRTGYGPFWKRWWLTSTIFVLSLVLGLLYELLHLHYPVWVWEMGELPPLLFMFLLCVGGYPPLMYVMLGTYAVASRSVTRF